MYIPFCPVPAVKAKRMLGTKFYGIAEPLLKIFPNLDIELKQADFDITGRDYLSIAFFSSFFMLFATYFTFIIVTFRSIELDKSLSMSFFIGMFFFAVTFFYIIIYPKLMINKRMMDIERNLLFALRHMYVQISSGVPVFDSLVSVSEGNYGAISRELKRCVKDINTGVQIEKALEGLATRNPSPYFRRTLWQISNGIRAGSDIGTVIKSTVEYVAAEQKIAIRKYGAQLNPLTLAYMMIAIIIPSLGITFLMILSSFAKIPVTESIFWVILGFLVLFQFMFLGVMKSKRPNIG